MFNIEGLVDTRAWRTELIKSISVPSVVHPYSLAIEYMKDRWFLPKFEDTCFKFKTVHVNGKHVFADQRLFTKIQSNQIEKPAVAITPTVDSDWNRESLDLYLGGTSVYHRVANHYDNRLIRDDQNNIHLGVDLKQLQMQFEFHMRVATRAEQLNLLDLVRMKCRVGATQGEYINMDCLIPKDIITAIAMDAGFELIQIKNGGSEVKDVVSFVKYLNEHSRYPITYKFRGINGQKEYFARLTDCYVHISCLDGISKDDGERVGQLDNNFHVDFTATLQMPMPAIFVYYSKNPHNIQQADLSSTGLYQLITVEPPQKNTRGWTNLLEADYVDESMHIDEIPFMDMFDSISDNDNLKEVVMRVLHHNVNELGISPAIFMDIQIFNDMKRLSFDIDWEHYIVKLNQDLKSTVSKVAIYVDLDYVNSVITNLDKLAEDNNRME